MKGGYVELVKYTYDRKSHGDRGFRKVERNRCEERWVGLGTRSGGI